MKAILAVQPNDEANSERVRKQANLTSKCVQSVCHRTPAVPYLFFVRSMRAITFVRDLTKRQSEPPAGAKILLMTSTLKLEAQLAFGSSS